MLRYFAPLVISVYSMLLVTSVDGYRASALVKPSSQQVLSRAHVRVYMDGTEEDDQPTPEVNPPTADDEPYNELNTLLRFGPVAFFQRVVSKGEYERGIEMFAHRTGCSRRVAQGNIDAALADPNSWVFNKLHAKDTPEPDYANVNSAPHQQALTATWGIAVSGLLMKAAWGMPMWFAVHPDWQEYVSRTVDGIPNTFL